MPENLFRFKRKALFIAIGYAMVGFIWIALSDRVVMSFTDDVNILSRFQTEKGFLFVLVTAILIYFLSKSQLRKIYLTATKLFEAEKKHTEELEYLVKERTKEILKKNEELEANLKELERMNELFVGREFRIKELKDRIAELEKRLKT